MINEKLYTVQSIAVSEQLANTDGRIVNEAPRQMLSGGGDREELAYRFSYDNMYPNLLS